jgi:DNA repair protein RecO (recombination protein O)
MNTQSLVGIVVSRRQLLGKDQGVVFFTRELGKVSAIAKGLRSSKSTRSAHLQTGNLVEFEVAEFAGGAILKHTSLVSGFSKLKESFIAIQSLYGLLFCLSYLLPELEPEPVVFEHVMHFMKTASFAPHMAVGDLFLCLAHVMIELGYQAPTTAAALAGSMDEIIGQASPLHDIIRAYGQPHFAL